MKAFWKRLAAIVMVICLISAVEFPADTALAAADNAAGKYVDLAGQYQEALEYVINNGLMSNSGNKIFPEQRLTKGAASLTLNALLGAVEQFADMGEVGNLKKGDQYYVTVSRGLNAGFLKQKANGDVYSPKAAATYNYLADIFSSVLGLEKDAAAAKIFAIMPGKNLADTLTRGEFAYIISNLAPNIITESARINGTLEGDVYVVKSGVILTSLKVTGNLIIGDGVGDGEVVFNNLEAENVIVRGGGSDSIFFRGRTVVKNAVMKQVNHNTSIKVEGVGSSIGQLTVSTNQGTTNIQGKVNKVIVAQDFADVVLEKAAAEGLQITASAVTVTMLDTEIDTISVEAGNASLDLQAGAAVAVLDIKAEGAGTKVLVEEASKVETLAVAANDITVTGEGTVDKAVVTEDSNAAIDVANDTAVVEVEEIPEDLADVAVPEPDPVVTTPPSSGGGVTPVSPAAVTAVASAYAFVGTGEEFLVTVTGTDLDGTVSLTTGGAQTTAASSTSAEKVFKVKFDRAGEYTLSSGGKSIVVNVLDSSVFKRTADYTITLSYALGVTIINMEADRAYTVTETANPSNTALTRISNDGADYLAGLLGKLTIDQIIVN